MDEIVTKHDRNHPNQPFSLSSAVFKRLQWICLIGYVLAAAGENLPDSYQYVLYESYGINHSTIELFYALSYGSSLFIGTFTAALADRYGRRLICFLYAGFLILFSILMNFSSTWILTIGSIVWGIGNAFYHTGFEAWLIQEHRDRFLDLPSLKRLLRNAYVGLALSAAGMGVFAQLLVQLAGYTAPFNAAIVMYILMIIFIWYFWSENYGSKETKATTTFITAFRILRADPRIVLLGIAAGSFEASLYIFAIEWTPTLQRAHSSNDKHLLPLGTIFAVYSISDLIGAFIFGLLAKHIRAQSYMIVVFLLAAVLLTTPVIVPYSLKAILTGFILFAVCSGIYRPSISLLRSFYIPNEVRATMMSYMRVPQIIFMLIILLSHFSLTTIFILCTSLNVLAMLCMIALRGLKLPEEQEDVGETHILLDEPSIPLFDIKQPQLRISSNEPIITRVTTRCEDSD